MKDTGIFPAASMEIIKIKREGKCVVPVRTQGSDTPLFIMAGLLRFHKLAVHIHKDQPFYCLEELPGLDVADTAAHYIEEIKMIQPTGPYCLAGFCRWGTIAVEMVQQLMQQREKISILVLIESYAPAARLPKFAPTYIRQRSSLLWKQLREQNNMRKKASFMMKEVGTLVTYCKNTIKQKLQGKASHTQSFSPDRVLLFKASAPYWGMKNDAHMGWINQFNSKLETFVIPGDHMSILDDPSVMQFADLLNTALMEANSHKCL